MRSLVELDALTDRMTVFAPYWALLSAFIVSDSAHKKKPPDCIQAASHCLRGCRPSEHARMGEPKLNESLRLRSHEP